MKVAICDSLDYYKEENKFITKRNKCHTQDIADIRVNPI